MYICMGVFLKNSGKITQHIGHNSKHDCTRQNFSSLVFLNTLGNTK